MRPVPGIGFLLAAALLLAAPGPVLCASGPFIPASGTFFPASGTGPDTDREPSVSSGPGSDRESSVSSSPGWPEARGPFSWADRVMNSTTISRGKTGVWQLRARTADLFTPTVDLSGFASTAPFASAADLSGSASAALFAPAVDLPEPAAVSPDPSFLRWLLAERMHEDAAALLFTPGLYAPSDTLDYFRGLLAYEVHDFPAAAECFSAVPSGSPYAPAAQLFLDTWRSTPEAGLKPRSPFLAGAMSAVIPGSGKIYAGDLSSGLSTFLIVGALGAMTAEAWSKLGISDWRTITAASLFGIFYIGNIYGSALSVSVIRNAHADAQKAVLLFGIRLPLHGE